MNYINNKKEPSNTNTFDLTQKDDDDGDKIEIIDLLSDGDDDDEVIVDRVVSAPPRNHPSARSRVERDMNTAAVPSNQQTNRSRVTQGDKTKDDRPEMNNNCRTEKSRSSSLVRSSDDHRDNQHNPRRHVGTTTSPAVHRPLDGRTGQKNDGWCQGDKYNMEKNSFPFRRTLQLAPKNTAVQQQQRQDQQAQNLRTEYNNNNNNSSAAYFRRRSNSPPPQMAPPPYTRVSAVVDPHKKNRGSRCEASEGHQHTKRSVSQQQSANRYREDVRNNKNSSNFHSKRRYPESENSSRDRTPLGTHVLQKLRPGDNDRLHRTTSQKSTRNQRDSRFDINNAPFPSQRQIGGTFSRERPLGGVAVHGTRHAHQSRQIIAQATSARNFYPTRNPSSSYPRAASAPHSREHRYRSTQVPNIRGDIPKRRFSLTHLGQSSPKPSEESSEESAANARPSRQQEVIEIPDSSSSSSSSSPSWSVDEEDNTNTRNSDLLTRPNSIVSSMPAQNSLIGTKRWRSESTKSNQGGRNEGNDCIGEYNEITGLKDASYAQGTEKGQGNTKRNSPSRDEIRRRRISGAGLRVNPKVGRSTRALTSYSLQLEKKPPPLSTMHEKVPLAPVSAVRGKRATATNEKRTAGLESPDLRCKQASQFDETSKKSMVETPLVASRPEGGGSLGHKQTVAEQARQVLCENESFQAIARDEGVGSVLNEIPGDKYPYQKPQIPAQKTRKVQLPYARHCQNCIGDSTIDPDSVLKPGEALSNQENPQRLAEKGRAIKSSEQLKPDMHKTLQITSLREPATTGSELLPILTNSSPVSTKSASESDKNQSDKKKQQPATDVTDVRQSFNVRQRTIEETAPLLNPPIHLSFEECPEGPAVSDEDLFSRSSDTPAVDTNFSSEKITLLFEESPPQNVLLTASRSGCVTAGDKTQNAIGDKEATKQAVPQDAGGDEGWYEKSQYTVLSSPKRSRLSTKYDSIFQIEPRRERLTVKVRDLGVGDEIEYTQITTVEHLTKDYIDERGLPVKEMVVYGGSDNILYRIRLHVEDTKFGYGAFLTYIGALRLKRSEQVRGDRMIAKREPYFPETTRLLDVIDVDGWEKTLRITGENLHGNNNNCYWPRYMVPIKAVKKTPSRIHSFSLKPTGHSCYVSDEDEEDAKYVEAKLREMKSKGLKPIGYLGIYSVEDYFPDQNVAFQLHGNVIDIGRYGPWRNQDRKPLSAFDMKCFLFQNQPNRYPIEAKQDLEGEAQMIDITDDVTGLPHEIAKAHIPMYVNEVGHDLGNKQTIFCTSSDNGRNANYMIALYDGLSLSYGSKVELLSNYHKDFEPTRELEGYGLRNLYYGLPDGKHLTRRIQNGISERVYMLETIRETGVIEEHDVPATFQGLGLSAIEIGEKMNRLSPLQFSNSVERIENFTRKPVLRKINEFLATGDVSLVSALQLVSNRRIGWLGAYYRKILAELKTGLDRAEKDGRVDAISSYLRALSYDQAGSILSKWITEEWLLTDGRNDPRIPGGGNESVQQTLRNETQEDVCFELKEQIVQAFDRSVWCPIACDLIEQLIDAVHFSDFQPWAAANEINESSGSRLEKDIREALSCASSRVISAILTGSIEELYFSSGLTEDHLVRGSISDIEEVCGSFDSLYLDNQTTPKCFISEVVRRFTVIGALGSAPTNTEDISPGQPLCHTDEFVMVRTSKLSGKSGSLTKIASIPQVATRKASGQINAKWYMLWQVAFPALSFAHRYIPSLEDSVIAHVCSEMNLEREWVIFALEKGIQQTPTKLLSNVCVPKKEIIFRQVSALVFHKASPHETGIEGKKRKRKDTLTLNKIHSRKGRRSQVDEALGGHRPVGSGRMSLSDEQRLECQDLRTTDKRRKKSGTTHDYRPPANLVWSGEPDEQFYPFNKEPINWPPGWKKQVFQRASGGTQGTTDRYWYTPKQSYKLRSLKEVHKFFACMERNENDETRAWKAFKKC